MENISLSGGSSGNWRSDYRNLNSANPEEPAKTQKNEVQTPHSEKEKSERNGQPTGEKEPVSEAARKKQEHQQVEKREEERNAQQKLLQRFYAEKVRIELSPEKLKDTMKALAERSIEQLMSTEGTSLKVEWKSELHKISLEISVEAYDKLNEYSEAKQDNAEAVKA